MSELDKIKECLDFFCRRCNEQGFYSPPLQPIVKEAYEAISALRSEPVAEVKADERAVSGTLHWRPNVRLPVGTKLYAAPSRETDQRESSGIRIEGSQSPGSNPAPMHGQSKTGLTGSHPGAPTQAEPALSAEQIEVMRVLLIKVGLNPALCNMALSSLTARDEGIEAAARRVRDALLNDLDGLGEENCLTQDGLEAIADFAQDQIRKLKGQP